MTDKAMMIIKGSGRVVTNSYDVASELDCNAIVTAVGDQELAFCVRCAKYLLFVGSDDPLNFKPRGS
jgi:hypothetical protein